MDSEFDFKLRIYRDCKAPIWSYYLYETLSKARKSAMEYLPEYPKVEIYAIGRGLNYGNDFVVETHFREEQTRALHSKVIQITGTQCITLEERMIYENRK